MNGFTLHEASGIYQSPELGGVYFDPKRNEYFSARLGVWTVNHRWPGQPANDLGSDILKGLSAVFTGGLSLAIPGMVPGQEPAPPPPPAPVPEPAAVPPPPAGDAAAAGGPGGASTSALGQPRGASIADPIERNYTLGFVDGSASRNAPGASVQEGTTFDLGYSAAYFQGFIHGRTGTAPQYRNASAMSAWDLARSRPAFWEQGAANGSARFRAANGAEGPSWADAAMSDQDLREAQRALLDSASDAGPDANHVLARYIGLPLAERVRFMLMLNQTEQGFSLQEVSRINQQTWNSGVDISRKSSFWDAVQKLPVPTWEKAANGGQWYNDLLGGLHLAGRAVLGAFGASGVADLLEDVEGEELPEFARSTRSRRRGEPGGGAAPLAEQPTPEQSKDPRPSKRGRFSLGFLDAGKPSAEGANGPRQPARIRGRGTR